MSIPNNELREENSPQPVGLLYAIDVYARPDGALEAVVRIPAWKKGNRQWAVWCPFCGAVHLHGRVEDDRLHRLADCGVVETRSYVLRPLAGEPPRRRPSALAAVARAAQQPRRMARR